MSKYPVCAFMGKHSKKSIEHISSASQSQKEISPSSQIRIQRRRQCKISIYILSINETRQQRSCDDMWIQICGWINPNMLKEYTVFPCCACTCSQTRLMKEMRMLNSDFLYTFKLDPFLIAECCLFETINSFLRFVVCHRIVLGLWTSEVLQSFTSQLWNFSSDLGTETSKGQGYWLLVLFSPVTFTFYLFYTKN